MWKMYPILEKSEILARIMLWGVLIGCQVCFSGRRHLQMGGLPTSLSWGRGHVGNIGG